MSYTTEVPSDVVLVLNVISSKQQCGDCMYSTVLSCGPRNNANEFQVYRCENSIQVSCAVGKNAAT
jgi:hypothetical protein